METQPGVEIRQPALIQGENVEGVTGSVEILKGWIGEGVVYASDQREANQRR